MVDCDLRRPTLSKAFGGPVGGGLTNILSQIFGAPIHQGDLSGTSCQDLCQLLAFQKRNGRLTLRSGSEEIVFYFRKGDFVDLDWKTRPESKQLTVVLQENGLLSESQAQMVRHRQADTGQRTGFVLSRTGLLAHDDLLGALSIHIMEPLRMAAEFNVGSYDFLEMPGENIDLSTSELVDLGQLFKQTIVARQHLPYLKKCVADLVVPISETLFLLPSGPTPPNPSEIVGSVRMTFLLQLLQQQFDVVVIDSPPLLPASDALLLAPQVDGVVMVVKAGFIERDLVAKSVEQLRHAQTNILGVVLNQVDTKREGMTAIITNITGNITGNRPAKPRI